MKIACLIHVHKNMQQVRRLVKRLDNACIDIYLHFDKKMEAATSEVAFYTNRNKVIIIADRINVMWGEYSQIQATIKGLTAIVNSGVHYDYVNFMSGQDYPLKSNDAILQFLAKNKAAEFINTFDLSNGCWSEGMDRYEKYWLHYYLRNEGLCNVVQNCLAKIYNKRAIPNNYKPYGGSQWWTLSCDCVGYILKFISENNQFIRFFKATRCPDEMFFQTIIMNSPFKNLVVNDNLRYIDWSNGGNHPRIILKDDLHKIISSNKLFARKFDMDVDEEIINMIDERLPEL